MSKKSVSKIRETIRLNKIIERIRIRTVLFTIPVHKTKTLLAGTVHVTKTLFTPAKIMTESDNIKVY